MKENLILVNYKVESEAYQALSELKRETSNANYTISQAAIVKKENGTLNIMDGFVNGATTGDDTWKGSLIGSLVGILGGPLGILLGGSMGMLIGGAVDANDMAENASLLEKAGDSILDGETAIILLAQEEYETALTAKLNNCRSPDLMLRRSRRKSSMPARSRSRWQKKPEKRCGKSGPKPSKNPLPRRAKS